MRAGASASERSTNPIRIGISMCLLGEKVRFDGGHKRDAFLVDTFGRYVEWLPVCPEVDIGLGTPREAMQLLRKGETIRLVGVRSGADHTDAMRMYAARKAEALASADLCGYILKRNSPSCGMERVKVYDRSFSPARAGRGVFAEALLQRLPHLPVEEEGRLSDPRIRDNFVERVFAYRRLRDLFCGSWTTGTLVRFHTAHKLALLAHSPKAYAELGRLVAGSSSMRRRDVRERYESAFMDALRLIATPKRHVNVLHHMLGYFRDMLDAGSRGELVASIEEYGRGLVPLIVPITLFRHHVRVLKVAYLAGQVYLEPHPKELMLRNHV